MSEVELVAFRPNLFVRDVAAALRFYRDVLGMTVHTEFDDGSFALAGSGGAEVALVRHEAGFEITRPLATQPWGLRDFVVRDGDGHRIGIGERVAEG